MAKNIKRELQTALHAEKKAKGKARAVLAAHRVAVTRLKRAQKKAAATLLRAQKQAEQAFLGRGGKAKAAKQRARAKSPRVSYAASKASRLAAFPLHKSSGVVSLYGDGYFIKDAARPGGWTTPAKRRARAQAGIRKVKGPAVAKSAKKSPSPAQLAARAKFVAMVRARAAGKK